MAVTKNLQEVIRRCIADVGKRIDKKHIAFEVQPVYTDSEIILKGFVSFPQQERALLDSVRALPQVKKKKLKVQSKLRVFALHQIRFAQVNVPFVRVQFEARQSGEVGTQALFGAFMHVFFTKGRYCYCAAPCGYLGYVRKSDLVEKSRDDFLRWLNGRRGRVLVECRAGDVDIPAGTELAVTSGNRIILPNNKTIPISPENIYVYEPAKDKRIDPLLKDADRYLGVPYVWGGKSMAGLDCSGFTQLIFGLHNIVLPRDASQQICVGGLLGIVGDFKDFLPGDLLFFMGRRSTIVHVGISLGGDKLIHATIREGITHSRIDTLDMGGNAFRDVYVMGRRVLA